LVCVSSCSNTGSIRDDPYWTSRENSLELIELSSINKVSLVHLFNVYRSVDCNVRRYDIRIGRMTADQIGQPVTSVTLSKDGQCVLVSSLDNTVRLLDKETGELLNEYVWF
jgi:mitogen-activated protein kinase organizer 1